MSQHLSNSKKMGNDVEDYNAMIDRGDKIYGRFCGTLIVLGLIAIGVVFFMMIRELFVR